MGYGTSLQVRFWYEYSEEWVTAHVGAMPDGPPLFSARTPKTDIIEADRHEAMRELTSLLGALAAFAKQTMAKEGH